MKQTNFLIQLFSGIHQIALGLLPLGLSFWYYQIWFAHPIEKIYFTYRDGVLFLCDGLALLAILAWLGQKIFNRANKQHAFPHFAWWGLALCLLASLSIGWAGDKLVSFFVSLQMWLVFGLFLSVCAQPESKRAIIIGCCAALLVQIVIGFWQFGAQNTDFLSPLGIEWPGKIEPAMRGASIVEFAGGGRWLRVYGSLPHPNLLGGLTLMFLAGPLAIFLFDKKHPSWALALLAIGSALIVLTFSRSAWVGLVAVGLVLIFQRRKLPMKQGWIAGVAVLIGALSAAVPLSPLIFTRTGASGAATEEFSNAGRFWLIEQALHIIKDNPLTGVGVGNFLLEYIKRAPVGYLLEPVHNLPLLVVAELGIPGMLMGLGLMFYIWRGLLQNQQPQQILFAALLIGLLVTSLFDHYLWTLAPGRMLLGLAFALFASENEFHRNGQTSAGV